MAVLYRQAKKEQIQRNKEAYGKNKQIFCERQQKIEPQLNKPKKEKRRCKTRTGKRSRSRQLVEDNKPEELSNATKKPKECSTAYRENDKCSKTSNDKCSKTSTKVSKPTGNSDPGPEQTKCCMKCLTRGGLGVAALACIAVAVMRS